MFELCCDKCWHGPTSPCPDLVRCRAEGPLCHEDPKCRDELENAAARLTRRVLERPVVFVGTGTCGLGAGAGKTAEAVRQHIKEIGKQVDVAEVGCIGLCALEPLVDIQLPGRTRICYSKVTSENAGDLIDGVLNEKVGADGLVGQFIADGCEPWPSVPYVNEHSFFRRQQRWVLANCGIIDPSSIEEYLAFGGYGALDRALKAMSRTEIVDVVEKSGLRGRGGGGFPTGRKWRFALNAEETQRYLICNADEGDPGAFMDRALIEGDPHRLIEGLAIAAYAIGADHAYIYIRAEYPIAIERLEKALDQAKVLGLVGENVLGSGFGLDIRLKKGAGAFVCGEETALIQSVEGKRGMPRPRPPFPAVKGLFGKPTIINNVETLANIPGIINNGAEWFNAVGTEGSKGTKVFALSGNVKYTGLVEVPMGTTVREVIFDIGGGIDGGRSYKAAQIGGPSGGCIPESQLDTQIDYESIKKVGAIMGSGGLVVMDDRTCMVDVAKFFMDFIQRESCGKCIPCREGTRRMLEILERITRGRQPDRPEESLLRFQGVVSLQQLAEVIRDSSLCGLGQTAPNPVLSTLRWFREEYEAHVYDRRCPAGVCRELISIRIDPDKCKGCTLCSKKCPVGAIMGAAKSPHYIVPEKCIACGNCAEACRFGAIIVD